MYQRILGPGEQAAYMTLRHPNFSRAKGLTWHGKLQPGPLCHSYDVQLTYQMPKQPRVRVLAPTLECLEGEKIPHLYADGSLCLFYPDGKEWSPAMSVSVLLPWASEWLWNYEGWLATGEWRGG